MNSTMSQKLVFIRETILYYAVHCFFRVLTWLYNKMLFDLPHFQQIQQNIYSDTELTPGPKEEAAA